MKTTIKSSTMPASRIYKIPSSTQKRLNVHEDKIFVTVRVRPLSQKEQERKYQIAWECSDDHTLLFKSLSSKRSMTSMTSYTFDKVFQPTCSTEKVYKEGAKDVALSALSGINATIFAYGQTNSGKTFTMQGITEYAVNDIYKYIANTPERDFIIKISALEIYNETVIDLLNPENACLRLLDDPEKGTIVDKLVEEVVKDCQHLRHLISVCEAQRQVGETSLNDTSSRSHQIIRLTIESSLRKLSGCVESLVASLNFVDLAGSERASLTHADGLRLKEGCHINRSLLTLTTVIRNLSSGKRSCHIPYRESKLTRILQPSLGGNARTAIICTMSPASSHVDQTRNTLSFATRAKEVMNSAKVNMVVSDKQLVKHLQKEVARLEAELRTPETSSCSRSEFLLREKELQIQKMEMEMEEMKHQRDLAQSQLYELRRKLQQEQRPDTFEPPLQIAKCPFAEKNNQLPGKVATVNSMRDMKGGLAMAGQLVAAPGILVHEIRKLEQLQKQLGEEANRALEVLRKEVACHRLGNQDVTETISKLLSEIKDMRAVNLVVEEVEMNVMAPAANLKEEITRLNSHGIAIAILEEQLENVQKSIDKLILSLPNMNEATPKSRSQPRMKKILPLALSNSINRQHIIRSPCSPLSSSQKVVESDLENQAPENDELLSGGSLLEPIKATPTKSDVCSVSSRESTPANCQSSSVNVKKMQKMFKTAAEENIRSIKAYVTDLKERVAKLHFQKQILVRKVLELEADEGYSNEPPDDSLSLWPLVFEDQQKQIVMLWHLCHVSIIRRTQFYLLFRGEPSDQIYIEVELRRLTWLEHHLAELGNASPALLGDEPAISVSSSIKALKQERESLAKRVNLRMTPEEREMLYVKWDVPPGGKQRRLMLVNKLWTDPYNMQHIKESAEIVAKLIGFQESERQVSKEMFELHFNPPTDKRSWFVGWNAITDLLHL